MINNYAFFIFIAYIYMNIYTKIWMQCFSILFLNFFSFIVQLSELETFEIL